jgi:hypothetical protein
MARITPNHKLLAPRTYGASDRVDKESALPQYPDVEDEEPSQESGVQVHLLLPNRS